MCRRHGISEWTFYRWKSKYGGMEVAEAKRLKALEDENVRLKRLVAEQALDNQMLRDLARKCVLRGVLLLGGEGHLVAQGRELVEGALAGAGLAAFVEGRTV